MDWWTSGGVWMYAVLTTLCLCLAAGFVGVLMSVSAFFFPVMKLVSRISSMLLILTALLPVAVGGIGWMMDRMNVAAAVENADAAVKEQILALGYAEAFVPLQFGISSMLCVLAPAGLALIISILAPGPKREDDDA